MAGPKPNASGMDSISIPVKQSNYEVIKPLPIKRDYYTAEEWRRAYLDGKVRDKNKRYVNQYFPDLGIGQWRQQLNARMGL